MSTIADPIADSIAYPVGAEERRPHGHLRTSFTGWSGRSRWVCSVP